MTEENLIIICRNCGYKTDELNDLAKINRLGKGACPKCGKTTDLSIEIDE